MLTTGYIEVSSVQTSEREEGEVSSSLQRCVGTQLLGGIWIGIGSDLFCRRGSNRPYLTEHVQALYCRKVWVLERLPRKTLTCTGGLIGP